MTPRAVATSEPPLPPRSERFVFVRPLGSAGDDSRDIVWVAQDERDGVDVALKTLRHLDASAIYRLKREFRSLADLSHPNLARLHELVCENDQWFLSMELVEGRRFDEYVRPRGQLDEQRLRRVIPQLVFGLSALHRAGKLHRDLKPSNVLVTPSERVVLVDFALVGSLASASPEDSNTSIDSRLLDSPIYGSPEHGSTAKMSEASDWYSVGIMTFEALTGRLPFEGAPFEMMAHKQLADGPAPSTLWPEVPPDFDALVADLLRSDPTKRPGADEILSRIGAPQSPKPSVPPASIHETPKLFGRASALATLHYSFEASRRGRTTIVHVRGESGVGKTVLLRRFLDEAASAQALVLASRCYERESLPYKALDAIVDDLSRYLRRLLERDLEELLPRDIGALARLFPVLGRVPKIAQLLAAPTEDLQGTKEPSGESRLAGGGAQQIARRENLAEMRRRAFGALRELITRICTRRPVVLAIDDLQWGDVDSVVLLADLLRAPAPPPLLLVVTYRSEDAGKSGAVDALGALPTQDEAGRLVMTTLDLRGSTTAVRRLRDDGCVRRDITLGPLVRKDAELLARAALNEAGGDAAVAADVAAEADGHPLLIIELARMLARQGGSALPRDARGSVDALADARLSELGEKSLRLLRTLAVATRPIDLPLAIKAAEITDGVEALAQLRSAKLVRVVSAHAPRSHVDGAPSSRAPGEQPDRIEPHHDRVRARVLAPLSAEALADEHLRLANAIEVTSPGDSLALATHFRAAGARWKAGHYATLAAAAAAEALAFERAASLYRIALAEMPEQSTERRTVRIALADVLAHAGRGAEAAREYLLAADGLPTADMLQLHQLAARHLLQSGHIDEGIAVITTVLRALDLQLAKSPRRALLSILWRRGRLHLRGLDWVEKPASACDPEAMARVDALWSVSTGLSMVDTIRATEFNTRHTVAALELGEPFRVVQALAGESWFSATQGAGSAPHVALVLERLKAAVAKVASPHAEALKVSSDAYQAFAASQWDQARRLFESAATLFREKCTETAWELATVQIFWLHALVQQGRFEELDRLLPNLLEDAHARGDRFGETTIRVGPASLMWLAHDDPEAGRRDVDEAMSRWSQAGFHLQHWYALISRAQFDIYERKGKKAFVDLNSAWPVLEESMLTRIERVRVESHFVRGRAALVGCSEEGVDSEAMLASVERDARALERIGTSLASAYEGLLRAGLSFRRRNVKAARERLDTTLRAFEEMGMGLFVAVVQRRRGRMMGGDVGNRLIDSANAWMESQGVQRPRRMAALVAAGFQR